jgi:hypothetical protein
MISLTTMRKQRHAAAPGLREKLYGNGRGCFGE